MPHPHYAHDHLSDYEIALYFGDTLQLIYKEKMAELNEELAEAYALIDRISIPQIPQWQKDFAIAALPERHKRNLRSIEHINKIRGIYKKIKSGKELLSVEKARNTPITEIYEFKFKGKNVSCPFHDDKHPSASIKYNKLVCFQCGYKGDSIKLFMDLNKVNFHDAVKTLSN